VQALLVDPVVDKVDSVVELVDVMVELQAEYLGYLS
jgi:alpha-galactosidase/6-phospho-beta-glucosidase family protein